MPTYEYRCNACEHQFELFQSITAGVKRKCPACGKNRLERLIGTGSAVLFKGSGFYQTDYRSESYKKSADADKPSKPESKGASKDGSKDSSSTSSTKIPKASEGKSGGSKPGKTSSKAPS